jgi:rubrerythrin
MNVFDMALTRERELQEYYEKLAKESELPGVKKIFTLLAGDEQRHFELIQALQREVGNEQLVDSATLEVAKEVVGAFIGNTATAASLHNDLEAYQQALAAEAESIRLYERVAEQEQDGRRRSIIEKILLEERKHYNIVENLYDYALEPTNFLAWAEFSNLREL